MKSEDKIQQEIVMWYRNNYCLKHHTPRNIIFSVPNDSKNATEQMRKIATGLYAGVSDLIIIHFSKVIFVEVKTDIGRQSDKQKEFENIIKEQNLNYWLVRSLLDFKSKLIESI